MEQTCNPRRRVGSFTLGLCLILAGLSMLLYYFWPAFDYAAAAKLAPLILVFLGAEVLFFAARPGQRKYDFLSVFLCLVLVGCATAVSFLPLMWQQLGPAAETRRRLLENELQAAYYNQLQDMEIADLTLSVYPAFGSNAQSVHQLTPADHVWISVDLTGPYTNAEDFAESCLAVCRKIREVGVPYRNLSFAGPAPDVEPDPAEPAPQPESTSVESSPVPPTATRALGLLYHLDLSDVYAADCTAAQLAAYVYRH